MNNNQVSQISHNILISYLPIYNECDKNLIWKYNKDINIFNKFTQFKEKIFSDIIPENILEIIYEKVPDTLPFVSEIVPEIVPEIVSEIVPEIVPEIVHVNTIAQDIKIKKSIKNTNKKEFVNKKNDNLSPLEFIIDHCCSSLIAKDYIKQKLIETISRKDYIKIFGLKKSSEIMSGITKDKWNKSIALFMSFLTDNEILYKGEKILYNKDRLERHNE